MARKIVVLAACLLALLPATAAAERTTVRSGSLEVSVRHEPFGLAFRDASDGTEARTVERRFRPDDPRAAYGPLGYAFDLRMPVLNSAYFGTYARAKVETLWFHATRVVGATRDGDAAVLAAETDDPLGHRLEVRISPYREGEIELRARLAPGTGPFAGRGPSATTIAFESGGERFFGFGERSNAVDQTGNSVFNWAEEGPFSSGSAEPLLRPLIPNFTFPSGPTATNFPVPWTVTSDGLGFLVDQTEYSEFFLRSERPDAWRAEVESADLRFRVVAGPTPADVVRRYTRTTGRQPDPAPWIFGPWLQAPQEVLERFRREDVPTTVLQTYTHYLPCGAHEGRRDEERERTAAAHRAGTRITTYFNPHICTSYRRVWEEARDNGWLIRNGLGSPYVLSNPFTADQVIGQIDFTAPGAQEFFGRLLDEAIDDGYDGWMEDFGEYTPSDSVFANGQTGATMHNRFPVDYHAASTRHTEERMGRDAAVFIRSGFHGVQPHARVVWGGDPTEDWSCSDGLCAAVHQALSMGLSGIAYWGSDIGGFHAVVNPRTDAELNVRWLQFGAVSGVMRTQQNGWSFQDRSRRSQVYDPDVQPHWRRWAKLRTQLAPYWERASEQYQRTGMPITRHHSLVYPGDRRALLRQTEFTVGDDLLAAPVLEPGARERTLYLPRGEWVDLHRSSAWRERVGTLALRRARVLRGGREVTVPAPLEEMPLFARAGAILPMLPPDVETLADVGEGVVRAEDRRNRLHLIAFPRGRSRARLAGGGRVDSRELRGRRLELRISLRRAHRLRAEISTATLRRSFRPCRVTLDGRRVRSWRWSRSHRALRLSFRVRRGRLQVQGRDSRGRCPATPRR